MPEVSPDGKTWTVRIRPGIYFADDPAFKGRKRELTAQDYVYSLKRHFDPKNKSVQLYLIDKRIVGMDTLRKAALEGGKFDYDREVEGLRAIDRYAFRVVLKELKPTFIYDLAYCNLTCAVAREVIEAYPDRTMEHPVGTNAYRLTQWKRSSRMVLERNPNYREHFYAEEAAADDPVAQAIAARMRGKRLPQIDRVEVYIIEEAQPRWLAFLNAEHDLIDRVPEEFANLAAPGGELAPHLQRRRVQLDRTNEFDLTFAYFGMEHPLVGGYTAEKVAEITGCPANEFTKAADLLTSIRKDGDMKKVATLPVPTATPSPTRPVRLHDADIGALFEYEDRSSLGLALRPPHVPLRGSAHHGSSATLSDAEGPVTARVKPGALDHIRQYAPRPRWPRTRAQAPFGDVATALGALRGDGRHAVGLRELWILAREHFSEVDIDMQEASLKPIEECRRPGEPGAAADVARTRR